ncbi:oligosaccharide MFS transporter [Rhizomicrobium electricum]|uniref:MFS transporter n=1 Tax=Rhizomicrobium electricum TaxID=480070 RepID=A0ABN1ESU6_9PROT|nr:oligosaccharide MFS transporter [Rhizomicrobium electricum]NIJ49129.1 OHS family lactose permease-like MFS transporter [Rhizomicrobium electricum]
MDTRKTVYAALSGFMFAHFFAEAMSISLLAIWLKNVLHLSGMQAGLVFSANFFTAMCVQPLYGFISDKVGLNKTVLSSIAGMVVLCGMFFTYVYGPMLLAYPVLGAIVGGLYLGFTFIAGRFVIESYVDRAGRKYGFEFGRARLWGSLGYALAAFFSGSLFNIDPRIDFFLATAAGLVMLVIIYFAPLKASVDELAQSKALRIGDALAVLGMAKFWRFMVLILGVTTLYLVYDLQFPAYFASQFPDPKTGTAMFGYLNSAQIFVEAGMFFLAPIIVGKTGAKNGLLLAAAIMIIRIAGSGIVTGPVLISCMKMLHSLELPILVTSIFRYIAGNFEARLASTLYLVSTGFVRNTGLMALSVVVGQSYDVIGFPKTYLAIAVIASAFWLLSVFALAPDKKSAPQTAS